MLILDGTGKSLEFKLSGAVATNQIPSVVAYVDKGTSYTPAEQDAQSNGSNTVTITSAPSANVQREIKTINISNIDTAAVTVRIQYNNNATIRILVPDWTLQIGEVLQWTDLDGWSVYALGGGKKSIISHGKTIKTVSGSLTADTDVITAVSGKKLKVIGYSLTSSGTNANTVIFKSNGTSGTELWRLLMQSSTAISAGANLAVSAPSFIFSTLVGEKLTMDVNQTDTIHYSISYYDDDAT